MNTSKPRAICVLGMHRSGTSAITRAINMLGASLGSFDKLVPPGVDNREGFWENADIVQVHDDLMSSLKRSWDTTVPLPYGWWKSNEIQPYRDRILKIISEEFIDKKLWVWKDPRTCLLVPLWNDILHEMGIDVSYVIVLRNPLDVYASLQKRNGFSLDKSLGMWHLNTLSALYWTRNLSRVMVHFDQFMDNWERTLISISDELKIPWPKDEKQLRLEMLSFLQPNLRHSVSRPHEIYDAPVPNMAVNLYRNCMSAISSTESRGLNDQLFVDVVEKLYSEYTDYSRLINNPQNGKFNIVQAFWKLSGSYNELNSRYSPIQIGEEFNVYEFEIPLPSDTELRIDPTNFAAEIEIAFIHLVGFNHDGEQIYFYEISPKTEFKEVINMSGLYEIKDDTCLRAVSSDSDPQIILSFPRCDKQPEQLFLRISMRANNLLNNGAVVIMERNLKQQSQQIVLQTERLQNLNRKLEKLSVLVDKKDQLVSNLRDELDGIKIDLLSKDQLVSNLRDELDRFKIDISCKDQLIKHQNEQINKLNDELLSIYDTVFWKIARVFYKRKSK